MTMAQNAPNSPLRQRILTELENGSSYEVIGQRLGIPAGQAYMIATGLPADGSDVLDAAALEQRPGLMQGASQKLVNPPADIPTRQPEVEAWLRERALADAQMQAAAAARTAEPPPVAGEGDSEDVIDILGWDHNQVKYILEQLQAVPGKRQGGTPVHMQERVSLVDMIRLRLSEHELAEEEYFWPAVRSHLEDGDALADQALGQEQEGKDLLQALDGLPGDADEFDELVEKLVLALRTHVAFEDSVFLQAKSQIPDEEREQLGRKIQSAKSTAPTRPHPHAPNRPPFNKVAGALAAPLDRARDALGDRPAERHGQAEDGGRSPAERAADGEPPRLPSERDEIDPEENRG